MNPRARLVGAIAFFGLLLLAAELTGWRKDFSVEALRTLFRMHIVEAVAMFVLLFCVGNLLQIPGLLFLGAAQLALGTWPGACVTYLAATLSCAVTYAIARWLAGGSLQQIRGRRAQALLASLHRHPVRNVFLLRLLLQTFPSLNVALGLSSVGFGPYMLGTVLGLPFPIAFYSLLFDQFSRAL